jgi:superfamily II DNA or RNA helicase
MENWSDFPDLSREMLVEFAGWGVVKEARALHSAKAVQSAEWKPPNATGIVGTGSRPHRPQINLRSLTFAECRCDCAAGRRHQFCEHGIALLMELAARKEAAYRAPTPAREKSPETDNTDNAQEEPAPTLTWLRTDAAGPLLRLRILLPPNLEAATRRNAIPVRLEMETGGRRCPPEKLFRGTAYQMSDNLSQSLALLEQWCGGRPSGMLQLKNEQLAVLVFALGAEQTFRFVNAPEKPLKWAGASLEGVTEHLAAALAAAPSSAPADVQIRRSRSVPPPVRPAPKPSAVEQFLAEAGRREALGRHATLEVDGSPHFLSIQLPEKEDAAYEGMIRLVRENGFRLEHSNGRWWLRDRHKALNFLAEHEPALRTDFKANFTPNFERQFAGRSWIRWRARAENQNGTFRLHLDAGPDAPDPDTIRRTLASGQFYALHGNTLFLIDTRSLARAEALQRALSGNPARPFAPSFDMRVAPSALAHTESLLEDLPDKPVLPEEWKARTAALRSIGHLAPPPVEKSLDERLRSYQRIGAAWLWHLARHELGGVLADEMGLGKTIQAIALLTCPRSPNAPAHLVVCPASLLENWRRELHRFAPALRVFIHHGSHRLNAGEEASAFDIVITSYGTLRQDESLFLSRPFTWIIADEAQHIKNRRTQAAQILHRLQAHARFVLTGTPVENSVDDLRSLFSFILPGHLSRVPPGLRGEDKAWFDAQHLREAAPYILRRDKRLVAPELPEKQEQVLYCEMTPAQETLYQTVKARTEGVIAELELSGASEAQVRVAALAQLLRLRQVCAEPRVIEDTLQPRDSGKLRAFSDLLDEALDGGHRMLVFSQFVSVLAHLRTFLDDAEVPYAYLDGSTRHRQAECDRFNNDTRLPIFLISLKAGGVGLNLTGADTVVHFDPWWNPAVEAQATDRAHRIGQTRTVNVYKMIMTGTVEERVLEYQADKATLLKNLLDESADRSATISLTDIKSFLKGL